MCILRRLGLAGMVLIAGFSVWADQIPVDGDAWSEYGDAAEAVADGWTRTCGLSQQIVVLPSGPVGSTDVGVQAIQARWDKPFELDKSVSLKTVIELRFYHLESWAGRNVYLRIYMTPTLAEETVGITEKRITFNYETATVWTEYMADFASGTWNWNDDSGMWNAPDGTEELTQLTKIEWYANYFPYFYPVSIGDQMLLDGLHFVTDEPDLIDLEELAEFCSWWMVLCDFGTNNCDGYDYDISGQVDLDDFVTLSQLWLTPE